MIATEKYEVKDFVQDVINNSHVQPVLVDFWAEYCEPCKFIGPILEKLAKEDNSQWRLVKVNTDNNPQLAREWGIRGVPNLKLFFKGKVIDEVAGAMAEADMRTWLDKRIPSKAKIMQFEGLDLIQKGDITKGINLLEKAIAADTTLEQSKLTLAKYKLWESPEEVALLLKEIDYLEQAKEILLLAEVLTFNVDLFKESKSAERLRDGLEALREMNFDRAIENFIKAIIIDKPYMDQLARRLTIALFHYLGESHDLTRKYRRQFDMALY